MTGIEPANSSVQGRRGALTTSSAWFRGEGSNPQHPAPKASVLPLNYHGVKTRRGMRAGSAFRGAQADCWSTSLCRITHYLFGPVRVGDGCRTRVPSLEDWYTSVVLHRRVRPFTGFEAAKSRSFRARVLNRAACSLRPASSGRPGSNRRCELGKLACYRYTTPTWRPRRESNSRHRFCRPTLPLVLGRSCGERGRTSVMNSLTGS